MKRDNLWFPRELRYTRKKETNSEFTREKSMIGRLVPFLGMAYFQGFLVRFRECIFNV